MSDSSPQQDGKKLGLPASVSSAIEAMKRGDIALALGVIAILIVLILPMPSWLLDISLALSITL